LGVTAITILGLLKLNIMGDGMTESVKSLWRDKSPQEIRDAHAVAKDAAATSEE
jgi:hypothetical protein